MPRWLRALWLLLCAIVALPALAQSEPAFPPLSGRVVDAAKILSPEQVQQLTQLSADAEKASTRQLVVATIPDLQGYAIEDYGYRLGRAWDIGQKDANNGIILIVAPKERKVRIEVGYGLEPIMTDALASVIINQTILPRFRDGDMGGGIVAGAQAIADQLKAPLEAAEQRAQAAGATRTKKQDSVGDWMVAAFWIIVVIVIVLPMMFGRGRGRRFGGGGVPPVIIWGPGWGSGGGGGGGGWGSGGSSWGGGNDSFSGGGGSFGGGGASGDW